MSRLFFSRLGLVAVAAAATTALSGCIETSDLPDSMRPPPQRTPVTPPQRTPVTPQQDELIVLGNQTGPGITGRIVTTDNITPVPLGATPQETNDDDDGGITLFGYTTSISQDKKDACEKETGQTCRSGTKAECASSDMQVGCYVVSDYVIVTPSPSSTSVTTLFGLGD